MMMNWVRETKTVTITPPMVTRHDSYSVISISPGKLLSTSVVFIMSLLVWFCSSPGLITFGQTLLSLVLLFALIVNCHLIVSWYDQLPPSSRKHRLQVTTAIYNSITQYFSNQPPAAGVCMNKDRFELWRPRSPLGGQKCLIIVKLLAARWAQARHPGPHWVE